MLELVKYLPSLGLGIFLGILVLLTNMFRNFMWRLASREGVTQRHKFILWILSFGALGICIASFIATFFETLKGVVSPKDIAVPIIEIVAAIGTLTIIFKKKWFRIDPYDMKQFMTKKCPDHSIPMLEIRRPSSLEKFGIIPFFTVFFGTGFARIILQDTYFHYPLSPDAISGRVIPDRIKWKVAYITETQNEVLHWLYWTSLAFCVITVIVAGIDELAKFKTEKLNFKSNTQAIIYLIKRFILFLVFAYLAHEFLLTY